MAKKKDEKEGTFDRTLLNEGMRELERRLDELTPEERAIARSKLRALLTRLGGDAIEATLHRLVAHRENVGANAHSVNCNCGGANKPGFSCHEFQAAWDDARLLLGLPDRGYRHVGLVRPGEAR